MHYIKEIFRFEKNGKMKSALIASTFIMSILFVGLYFLLYWLLIDGFEGIFLSSIPSYVMIWIEIFLPAGIAVVPCLLLMRFFHEKRLVPFTFLWLLLYAVFVLIAILTMLRGETEAQKLFLLVYVRLVLGPVLLDGGVSWLYYFRKHQKL
jgi:hypothetical protein